MSVRGTMACHSLWFFKVVILSRTYGSIVESVFGQQSTSAVATATVQFSSFQLVHFLLIVLIVTTSALRSRETHLPISLLLFCVEGRAVLVIA
jgi:hypothetical protein